MGRDEMVNVVIVEVGVRPSPTPVMCSSLLCCYGYITIRTMSNIKKRAETTGYWRVAARQCLLWDCEAAELQRPIVCLERLLWRSDTRVLATLMRSPARYPRDRVPLRHRIVVARRAGLANRRQQL